MKIISSIAVLIHLVMITCKCTATNAVSISDVESEFARLKGTCGLWREFLPMIDRVGAAEGSIPEVHNIQIYTATNFLSRLQATTNDYVYEGRYDFNGASACVSKMSEWEVFCNSTNALMLIANGLGQVQPIAYEFGSESNDFANILVYANSKSSIAGHRFAEVTPEELKLRNKASFQGMYNQEVISFRRRALLCFFEIIKQKYSHFCLRKRKFLWKEFIRRAKATEEEISSLSMSR